MTEKQNAITDVRKNSFTVQLKAEYVGSGMEAPLQRFFIPLILILVALPCSVYGDKPAPEKLTPAEKLIEATEKAGDKFAQQIDKAARRLDLSLAGRRYTRKKNDSSISLKQLNVWSEGGVTKNSTSFGINLRLPNLEKRWQIRFSSYDEQEESRNLQQRRFRTQGRANRPGAALLFFRQLGKVKTTFQPRLELRDPLQMSYLLRFESEADQKPVRVAPRLEFFADAERGTGEYFQLNFSYDLTKRLEISLLNEEEYREFGNFLNVNHGLAFDYSLSRDKGIGWSFTTNSTNRGGAYHLESYAVSTAYGQELSEDRLRFILATFLVFAKPEAFKGDAGMSLQVEVIF